MYLGQKRYSITSETVSDAGPSDDHDAKGIPHKITVKALSDKSDLLIALLAHREDINRIALLYEACTLDTKGIPLVFIEIAKESALLNTVKPILLADPDDGVSHLVFGDIINDPDEHQSYPRTNWFARACASARMVFRIFMFFPRYATSSSKWALSSFIRRALPSFEKGLKVPLAHLPLRE